MGLTVQEAFERRKKKQEEEKQQRIAAYEASNARINAALDARAQRLASDVDEDYINTFLSDANRFLNSAQDEYNKVGWGNASSTYSSRASALDDLNARQSKVGSWLRVNKGNLKEDAYNSLIESLSAFRTDSTTVMDSFKSARDYYSQWKTEQDYNDYVAYQKDYEEKSKFDLKAGQKEIDDLQIVADEARNIQRQIATITAHRSRGLGISDPDALLAELRSKLQGVLGEYGDIGALNAALNEKKVYLNQAERIQEGITLSGVIDNADFKANSGYVSTKSDKAWDKLTSQYGMGYDDLTYEYINNQNGIRDEIKQKDRSYKSDNPFSDGESSFESKGYDHLTEDEIAIYNYYYAKEGKEKAQEYLDNIQETLNHRKATEMFSEMKDNTALEMVFGVEAGLDQWKSGTKNLFNTEDDYIAQSAYQMASGMVREDLADDGFKLPDWLGGASIGQVAYDAITTTANMAPSVLTSMVANMVAPGSGAIIGNAMMFASSAGGAYQEALNLGYDKSQARAYSTLVGASEAGLQYLLGGISSMGGKVSGKALSKMLDGIDNAFARTALKVGGNMLSEGVEEGLQEVLTPLFKNWTLKADEDINWSEVAYSGLLGALTAGFMEGPTSIAGEVKTYNTGKQLKAADISAERLAELGNTFAADTVAHKLAGKVNEKTGAYTMGRLFNEIGATLTEQNVNDITEALVAKNMDRETARANAEAMATVVEGGNLTDLQVAVIEANETLAEAVRTTIIDSNATWFQRTKGYNEALMALAQEKTSPVAPQTEQSPAAQENAPTSEAVDTQNENGVEGLSEADTGPSKVRSISSIQKGVATVMLEDGSEVSVRDADLDPDDGVRIETIASIDGISSEDANFVLNTLRAAPGANAQVDALGAKEAYKYGYYGFSQEHIAKHGVFANSLNEAQRQAIYQAGQQARNATVQTKTQLLTRKATAAELEQLNALGEERNQILIRAEELDRKKGKTEEEIIEMESLYKQADAIMQKIDSISAQKPTGRVYFEGDRSTLTERQSASLTAMEKIADVLGVQIHVFESQVNERGKRIGANGWYDPKDSSIHIDLHAGANGEGTMLFTAAHELTHHIRKWSPEKFKTMSDFLMQEYGKKDVNVDGLVREQMNKAKRNGRTISYDTAFEEVVADSMETMLSDGNVIKRLEKLKAQDKDLWHKIKSFIDDLAAKIRNVYKSLRPDSVEGRYVAEMGNAVYKLQELFAEGLVDASANYQAGLTPGEEGVVVSENGDPVAYSTEDGSVLLSMRTYEEEGREAFRKYLQKCVTNKILTKEEMQDMLDGIEDIYTTCKEFKDKYAPFSSWSDAAVVRDTRGKPVFSVVTPNGDYKMNLDFSLVCKKRRTLDAVFNEMTKRGIIDDFELGQKSVVKINEIIRKYGLETACALCFVDAKRFRQASMADQFTRLYNELVESLVPEDQKSNIDHFNFSGYETIQKVEGGIDTWANSKLDFSHINHVLKTYGDGTVEYKAAQYIKNNPKGRKLLLRGDFMSSKGFDAVKTQNQDILKLYNSKKGTGGPKAAFGDVQYMNEVIQKARWWTPAKAYAVGGVRIQSFSDYVPRMVFDYTQMIYDLAATKLPAHAYTKEALFVKQFGLTGVKINMSLIPAIAEGGIAPGLDANGDYVWAGESFDFETAKEIQNAEGYTENCGTICVGVSYEHIRKLLSDPDIRMVIPYHKSGLNPIVAHMNKIAEFTDYTTLQTNPGGCQNTMDKNGNKVEVDFSFNEVLRKTGDPKATVRQYLDWCAKNEYTPRFAEFAWHENYYKLIEDFTLYDKDGNYVPQREVRPVFPKSDSAFGSMKDLIQEGLEEDAVVEGKRDKALSKIVDEIQRTIPKTEAEISEEQVTQADRDLEEIKPSIRDEFYKEFDAWDKKNANVNFITGTTSDALRSIGMKDQEIVLRSGTVLQKLKDHPEMTLDIFRNIPDLLEHPVIVQFSDAIDPKTERPKYESSITVLGELYADVKEDGKTVKKPVLVSLELLPTNQKKTAVLDFAIIKSAYSKNALQQYLNENSILYIDPDKKRTDSWLSLNRLQLPLGEKSYGPIRKIAYVDGKVKVQNPKNMTEMQKRLFEAGIIDEYGNKLFSDRDYSYNALVSKPDMVVTEVGGNVPSNRADIVALAKKNAAKFGKFDPKTGSVSVHVDDINADVFLVTDGLKHGLRRTKNPQNDANYIVTIKAGEILKNSIKINEANPKKQSATGAYVLIGVARNTSGDMYIVRSVVNQFKNELDSMDVLYAINAKKELAALNAPRSAAKPLSVTSSTISIAELLDYVNQYFPDILPEDVLKHYGYDARPEGDFGENVLYSERDNAPTFYSHMARVVDGVKQEKLGAASVISMLRGKGVKAEEIKWSGIETWLEGKKSVTKAELQEFIAGSMLQIEEETLDNKERPYTEDQQKRLNEYEAKRDEVAHRLANEWKKITGEEFPVRNPGAGLESTVVNKIIDANKEHKDATFEGRLLKKLRNDLKEVIVNNDDFGFDSWKDALRAIHRHRRDFIKNYEMATNDKAVIVKYCNALNAYNELPTLISEADTDRLRAIARETDPWTRKIMEVKHEHNEEEAKYMTNWGQYRLEGGKNYREMLFRIPGSTYTNEAMFTHWKERNGVLAHTRVQDLDTFLGKMLFIEEIQSDWHNEGHKEGYRIEGEKTDLMLSRESKKAYEEFYAAVEKMVYDNANWEDDNAVYSVHPVVVAEMFDGNESYFDKYGFTSEQRETIRSMVAEEAARQEAMKTAPKDSAVPDAPFKDNYHEYVLKRLLREAAEQDYDSIGWTTAETQDDRWQNNMPHKEGTGKSGFLKAYTIEYDQDIPKFMSKYGKKWGTRVGKTVLDSGTEVWSMAITDEMKESVLTDGQPLYSDRDYVAYDRTAILKESKVDEYLMDYAAKTSPKYAQAYIAYMRPGTFLKLTTDDWMERDLIAEQAGELDEEKLSGSRPGIYLRIDHETGAVTGHEGRHRMSAMDKAGIYYVPVLLVDTSNKMTKTDIAEITLHGQFNKHESGTVTDAIPLSFGNRDRVIEKFATQSSRQRVGERIGYNKTLRFSERDTESVSNRSLLANAFEGVAQNDIEKQKIQEYKGKISLIESEERKLQELNQQIKDLSFSKGPKDTKAIRDLQFEAKQTANRISTYDKQLLRLEASKPLQDVLQREKKMAYQRAEKKGKEALAAYRERATKTQRELMDRWQESRKRGIENREKTAMRHKIQSVVGELNNLLLNGDKKRHVPENLKKAVADALALVNMDTVGAEERAAKYANLIAKETDPDKIDAYTVTMENILRQGEKMGQRLKELRDAYEEFQESDDPDIANAYDPVIAGCMKELSQSIGNTSLRNMTIEQLSDVYDMYRMVLTRVRDANKTFLNEKKESISNMASRVVGEVRRVGGEHTYRAAFLDPVRKFLWNNLKPVYAFEHMGSSTLTEAFNGVRNGEDVWAKDVTEARAYYLDKSKKYGYDSWDFKKKYRFENDAGQKFELTLEQILSLYAYSKREQAHDHLRLGGFVFDSNIETYKEKDGKSGKSILKYKVNTADAHQITPEILAGIIGKLTPEQMGFVDEMQEYLSTTMGAKGNEITMKMYGVKLFKEKFYFPLKSAKQFMFEQNEVAGEVKIKNSGFTNKTVAKANNPVILSNFMEVWSGHVNDMSMYHAFVLPLEDFNRIFNYNSPKKEGQPPVSVKGTIQSAYSPAAVSYVKNLITDLNGGARTDSTTGPMNWFMGRFKKGSVFASLSVVIQQPSAIARATALVDTKYFVGAKVDSKRHKLLWEELKQYAPVAIIKEMGYFDTNMGKSTQDFILGKEYSGIAEKMKALVTDSNYRDEILSKAPALADELAWCSIWDAVKRETKAKNPGMDTKSDAFLQKAGQRFTEVIAKTQVYDSVLSRSANMRSKDTGMKMATAFMAEPTTSINMIADALLQGKRGNKKYARAAIGSVIASQIFNSILVSFVYAGRDDDEDKTYWEKYTESLTGNVLDGLNPMTYLPFIKDIVSIAQGYDVERSDMAVISDLWSAWQKLGSENLSVYRKVEGFAGSIAQIFGLPVKNIMRDVRGIYQTIDSFMNGQQTTKAGIGYAVKSAIPAWMGGGDVTNQNQIYEAIMSGDQTQIARVKSRYKDQSAIDAAVRKALRENDPRIKEAAQAKFSGDLDEYLRIAKAIIGEKHFSQDDVVAAVNAEINLLDGEKPASDPKAKGMFAVADFGTAVAQGDDAMANAAKTDIIRTAQKNGKTEEEAEKSFNSSAKSELKERFLAGEISEQETISALTSYCGVEAEDAKADVQYWAFKQDYPDVYADDSWFDKYYEEVADSGISIDMYMEYRNDVKDITGEGKKERRMAVIDSLPITSAQKDALYYAEGWAESKLYEAPWH